MRAFPYIVKHLGALSGTRIATPNKAINVQAFYSWVFTTFPCRGCSMLPDSVSETSSRHLVARLDARTRLWPKPNMPSLHPTSAICFFALCAIKSISADPVVQQGGARTEMVCSVVIVAIRWATASSSRDPTPKCFWCSVRRFLCLEQWSSVPATVELPAEIPARSVFGARCLEQWSSVPATVEFLPEP